MTRTSRRLAAALEASKLPRMGLSRRFPLLLVASLLVALLSSCETAPPTTKSSAARTVTSGAGFASAPEQAGVGTRWGETRHSRVRPTDFRRDHPAQPTATAVIHYDDVAGIRVLARNAELRRTRPVLPQKLAQLVSVEIRDGLGRLLPGFSAGGSWFVVGERGDRYSIVVRNETEARVEVVLSVDGLDVMDGRPASFRKRGYIIEPHAKVSVDGFRQSTAAVAAFRFGTVRESYANLKYGDTRNVGVIGIAVFGEYNSVPYSLHENETRLRGNPWPGQFASPPDQIPSRPVGRHP